MFLTSDGLTITHDFIFSSISMLKTVNIPYFGISFWTLYCGCFYMAIGVSLVSRLIGIGGGDISGGGSALRGIGSSVAGMKDASIRKKEKEEKERQREAQREYWRNYRRYR